jgi:hypothetical protein
MGPIRPMGPIGFHRIKDGSLKHRSRLPSGFYISVTPDQSPAFRSPRLYFTSSSKLSEWLLNSGAYMHWMLAMPVWYWPLSWMRVLYSKT